MYRRKSKFRNLYLYWGGGDDTSRLEDIANLNIKDPTKVRVLNLSQLTTTSILADFTPLTNLYALILPEKITEFIPLQLPKVVEPFLIFLTNTQNCSGPDSESYKKYNKNNYYFYASEQNLNAWPCEDQTFDFQSILNYVKSIYTYPINSNFNNSEYAKIFLELNAFYLPLKNETKLHDWIPYNFSKTTTCKPVDPKAFCMNYCSTQQGSIEERESLYIPMFFSCYCKFTYFSFALNKYDPLNINNFPYSKGFSNNEFVEISSTSKDNYAYLVKGTGVFYNTGKTIVAQNKVSAAFMLWAKTHNKQCILQDTGDCWIDFSNEVQKQLEIDVNKTKITDQISNKSHYLSEFESSLSPILKTAATSTNMKYEPFSALSTATSGTKNYILNCLAFFFSTPSVTSSPTLWDKYIFDMAKNLQYNTVQLWAQQGKFWWNFEFFTTRVALTTDTSKGIGANSGLYNCSALKDNSSCLPCIPDQQDSFTRPSTAAYCTLGTLGLYSRISKNE